MRGLPAPTGRGDGPLQALPAGGKLAAALAVVVAAVATPLAAWPVHAALAAGLVAAAALGKVPAKPLLARLLWLEPFVLGLALLALLQPDGLHLAAGLLVRSTLSLLAMLLLAATTPFPALLATCRRLRVPAILVTTLALMYRYLFLLVDEALRMQRARQSRTFTGRRWPSWPVLATVVGQLFVRATARAERVYAAMTARGYR